MKLSEILSKPFKVKGGGTVNLKGLSKHIVDKEIGGSTENSIYDNIFEVFNTADIKIKPHPYLVYQSDDIKSITDINLSMNSYFLYDINDVDKVFDEESTILSGFYKTPDGDISLSTLAMSYIKNSVIIDGKEYVYFADEHPE